MLDNIRPLVSSAVRPSAKDLRKAKDTRVGDFHHTSSYAAPSSDFEDLIR